MQDLPMVNAVGQGLRPRSFYTSGRISKATNKRYSFLNKDVDHKYFEMLGYQFIAGDNFTEQDYDDGKRLAVVNQSLAAQWRQDRSIIGYSFTNGVRIIGVVKDILVPGQRESGLRMYTLTLPSRNMLIIQIISGQSLSRDVLVHTLKEINEKIALFSYESLVSNRDQRMLLRKVTVGSAIEADKSKFTYLIEKSAMRKTEVFCQSYSVAITHSIGC